MPNLARSPALTKPRLAASRRNSAPWPLLRLLPAPIAQLPTDARDLLGAALDRGLARLVLGDDGDAFVVRGRAGR
jgi:hypothetical protein